MKCFKNDCAEERWVMVDMTFPCGYCIDCCGDECPLGQFESPIHEKNTTSTHGFSTLTYSDLINILNHDRKKSREATSKNETIEPVK